MRKLFTSALKLGTVGQDTMISPFYILTSHFEYKIEVFIAVEVGLFETRAPPKTNYSKLISLFRRAFLLNPPFRNNSTWPSEVNLRIFSWTSLWWMTNNHQMG